MTGRESVQEQPGDVASHVDPASFRDRDSRVFRRDGAVFRALSPAALADFEALESSPLFERSQEDGRLAGTRRTPGVEVPVGAQPAGGCAAVLEHDVIPFLSWPYEWPFAMLKDAALAQLALMEDALEEGLVLKDGTAYNTQWQGSQPTFIDVGSIERLREGDPWFGYRQFCMQFLFPLMLQSFRGVPFQPQLRGSVAGIRPADMAALLRPRDRLRRGVLTNVSLQARLEARYADQAASSARRELKRAGFNAELIRANVRKLAKTIRRLEWSPKRSEWSAYGDSHSYAEDELEAKQRFVEQAVARCQPRLVWDLGCNDGRFSRIAARHAGYVVAMDADQLSVDRLYRELREEGDRSILPLTLDLTDPSPNQGWRLAERAGLVERGRPDLVLCLALVHHITIANNVPVSDFVGWLASLRARVVVEFPSREDPMVERLLAAKREDAHPDYAQPAFEEALAAELAVVRSERIGTRTLYEAEPR